MKASTAGMKNVHHVPYKLPKKFERAKSFPYDHRSKLSFLDLEGSFWFSLERAGFEFIVFF
jgi:hypothetical protein